MSYGQKYANVQFNCCRKFKADTVKKASGPERSRKPTARKRGRPDGRPRRDLPIVKLSFFGDLAHLEVTCGGAVAAIHYDHVELPADRWRLLPGGTDLRVTCPPTAFDAEEHVISVYWTDRHRPPLECAFRSQYRAYVEVSGDHVRGSIHDLLRPSTPVTLELACGEARLRARADLPPLTVTAGEASASSGGFDVLLPPRTDETLPEWVIISVADTNYQPTGPVLRGITLPTAVTAASAAARALDASPTGRLFGTALFPTLVRAITESPLPNALILRGTQSQPRPKAPNVVVIVRVSSRTTETRTCLASILDGGNALPNRLVVIDEGIAEPAQRISLRQLADEGRIDLLSSEGSLCLFESINRGIALSSTADVVLLSADIEVPRHFLDRLYRAAYSDPTIATVTPLSKTLAGLSLSRANLWEMPCEMLDAICQEVNAGAVVDIPTVFRYCTYIKRAALDDVGMFDIRSSQDECGVEDDFQLRALLRGWRNVCVPSVYVRHVGATSFTGSPAEGVRLGDDVQILATRYPFYPTLVSSFLRTDPLHKQRNNVQKVLWRRHGRLALIVTLAIGGGAARHANDLVARLEQEGWLVLVLTMQANGDDRPRLSLCRPSCDEGLYYPIETAPEELEADILDLAPRFIHVQHVIDLPDGIAEFVRGAGIPYAVTLHDFFFGCPRVTLLDSGTRYCGIPLPSKCSECVRVGGVHSQLHSSLLRYADSGEKWRAKWEGLLREATQVIAPSRDTAERYGRLFPNVVLSVRPHFASPNDFVSNVPAFRPQNTRLRVAVPGALGPHKGLIELIHLAMHCTRWHDDIEFVVVGYTDRDDELERIGNVEVMGGYDVGQAVAKLMSSECRVALLLNVFPETFSYTLSESLAAGLTPVAYDFGAVGERMGALNVGVTVPLGAPPEQLVTALREAARQPLGAPPSAHYGEYGTLMSDYYTPAFAELVEVAPGPDQPCLLGRVHGLFDDRWCDGVVTFRLWSAGRSRRIAIDFWVPDECQFQAVEIACNGKRASRSFVGNGGGRPIIVPSLEDNSAIVEICCRFDFVFPMTPPDIRSCAAMLVALRVSDGLGWLTIELPA